MKYRKLIRRSKSIRYFKEVDGYYWVYTPKESYLYLPYIKEKIFYTKYPIDILLNTSRYKEVAEKEFLWATGNFSVRASLFIGKMKNIFKQL